MAAKIFKRNLKLGENGASWEKINEMGKNPLKRQTYADLRKDHKPVEWLIQPMIPAIGVSLVIGPSGVSKTFQTLNLALSVAKDLKYLEKFRTKQGRVLCVQQEDPPNGIFERIEMLSEGLGLTRRERGSLPIQFIVQRDLRLDKKQQVDWFKEILKEYGPQLVILDPLRRFHSYNENDSGDMEELFREVRKLSVQFKCAFLIVHHTGKTSEYKGIGKSRGSSVITDSVDSVIGISGKIESVEIEHSKSKLGPEIPTFHVRSEFKFNKSVKFFHSDIDTKKQSDKKNAQRFVYEFLKSCPKASNQKTIFDAGKENKFSRGKMETAFAELKQKKILKSKKPGRERLYWIDR